jgi:hypothetical protein
MTVKAEVPRNSWLTVIAVPPARSLNQGEVVFQFEIRALDDTHAIAICFLYA